MNRVKDYCLFAVCFAGLGYIALWPVTEHDGTIAAFEASLICGGRFLTDAICRLPQPLTLSPGLHLIGLLSALAVVMRYVLRRLARWRPARAVPPAPTAIDIPPARAAPRDRLRSVKPRRQFGLRGLPH